MLLHASIIQQQIVILHSSRLNSIFKLDMEVMIITTKVSGGFKSFGPSLFPSFLETLPSNYRVH